MQMYSTFFLMVATKKYVAGIIAKPQIIVENNSFLHTEENRLNVFIYIINI